MKDEAADAEWREWGMGAGYGERGTILYGEDLSKAKNRKQKKNRAEKGGGACVDGSVGR